MKLLVHLRNVRKDQQQKSHIHLEAPVMSE